MKKKTKQLLGLLAVAIALAAAYVLLPRLKEQKPQETTPEVLDVTEFATEDIASYSYQNEMYEIGFRVEHGNYVNTEDAAFPVNTATVAEQLELLGTMEYIRVIDNTDKSEFRLDDPSIRIAVTLQDGSTRQFFIGEEAPFDSDYYLLDVEQDVIYLVSSELYTAFHTTWTALVQKEDILSLTADQITQVTVESAVLPSLKLAYFADQEEPWLLTTAEGSFVADTDAVTEKLGNYETYVFRYVYEYQVKDLERYGLAEPVTTVTVTYLLPAEDGSLTEETGTLVLEFGGENETDEVTYVRMNDSSYVYGISSTYLEKLASYDPSELRK